jgi:hypothetical protein
VSRGKTAKANAKDALKTAKELMAQAQKKYDDAAGADEKSPAKDTKKKK